MPQCTSHSYGHLIVVIAFNLYIIVFHIKNVLNGALYSIYMEVTLKQINRSRVSNIRLVCICTLVLKTNEILFLSGTCHTIHAIFYFLTLRLHENNY